jgi:hypothetical protein
VWQGQDSLPYWDIGQDVVHEMRGAFCHPPPAAARTEAAPLAGERHESLGPTRIAPQPSEPAGEEATAQKRLELGVDESRQPLAVAQARRLDAKVSTCSRTTA